MFLKICIPNTPFESLDYLWEKDNIPAIGTRIKVPFRRQEVIGLVVGHTNTSTLPKEKIRETHELIDIGSFIDSTLWKLYQWISHYYHAPFSDLLAQALPTKFRKGSPLVTHFKTLKAPNADTNSDTHKKLNTEQQNALDKILAIHNTYHCFLLQGITGSGKTEVYLQAAAAILERQQQVLILVPEIGLTPQLYERFSTRFSNNVIALVHSGLNDTHRWEAWCGALNQRANIIIGTRSAIFTPIPKLGLIIVDEEHDASFKQQETPRYSARDTAIMRAQMQKCPIILGSATPSLETLQNAVTKKYTLLKLTQRAKSATPPIIKLIDMRKNKVTHGLTKPTIEIIEEHLNRQEQVLVFINRRGYAPVLLCPSCNHALTCPHCSSRLTLHQKKNHLKCHQCDHTTPILKQCPSCKTAELIPVGVGTERLESHLRSLFPNANIARIDRDTVRKPELLEEQFRAILEGKVDIIIGTQMLAKGHHFPHLTLAILANIDQGFFSPDFRAAEKIGQLILQVAGRAGREEKIGTVLIQTYVPDNASLQTLLREGYSTFSHFLLSERLEAGLPPFGHIAMLRCQSSKVEEATLWLSRIKKFLTPAPVYALGPAPAPLEKKAGVFRMQLLITAKTRQELTHVLQKVHQFVTHQDPHGLRAKKMRFSIDRDPHDLS